VGTLHFSISSIIYQFNKITMITKKEMKVEIKRMLDAFMANSYLVPSTRTEFLQFSNMQKTFRTYANESRDYFYAEIKGKNDYTFNITASKYSKGWTIQGENLLEESPKKGVLLKNYKYIKAIYEEVHSLDVSNTRLKEVRRKINEQKEIIKKAEKQIAIYNLELSDSKKLQK
jgi:hypothetical protein